MANGRSGMIPTGSELQYSYIGIALPSETLKFISE